MITEKLAKLNEPKRISASVLTVLVTACVCYYVINRDSIIKLRAAKAKHISMHSSYAGTENQRAVLQSLQRRLDDVKSEIRKQREECFSREQCSQFFESINTLAVAHNLQPVSRIISESKKEVVDEKTEPELQVIEKHWAKVAFTGNYLDIVDFIIELTDRPQKVCITELHILLAAGEKSNPTASFKVLLLVDSSRRKEK